MPSAGSVHVDVLPDTKRFGPRLSTELRRIAATQRTDVSVRVRVDTGAAMTKLRALRTLADELDGRLVRMGTSSFGDTTGASTPLKDVGGQSDRTSTVRVNTTQATAALRGVSAQARALNGTTARIKVEVDKASAARTRKQLQSFSDVSPAAATAASVLVPPAAPLAGAAVGGAAGLLPGAGAGIMALGGFALAAVPAVLSLRGALSAQSEAAAGGAKENKAFQEVLADLSPHAQGLVKEIGALTTEYKAWHESLQVATLPVMTQWVGLATDNLKSLTPVVIGASRGLSNLADSAEKGLAGPYWQRFISFSARQAEPTLTSLGRTFGNLALGVTGLAVSFEPLWESMSTGMENSSRSFADWANDSSNFTDFIAWTIENGPMLMGVLGDIGGAIIDVGVAISPLGLVYAQGIGLLAEGLSWLAETSPGLLQLAVAAVTARMALQLLGRINQGIITPLRELPGRVQEFAGSLRTVDGAATTAGGGVGRFQGALGGAMGVLGGPWGIALLAATTVLGIFIAKKQEAKQRTEEFQQALRADGGAISESTQELLANIIAKEDLITKAEQFGLSTEDIIGAMLGEEEATRRVTEALEGQTGAYVRAADGGSKAMNDKRTAANELEEAIFGSNEELENARELEKTRTEVMKTATEDTNTQAEANRQLADTFVDAATQARDLNTALSELSVGTIGLTDAEGKFHEAVEKATQAHAENGLTLDQKTEAGRRNHESLVTLRDSINQTTEAQRNNDDSAMQMIVTHRRGREEFIQVRMSMGETRKQAEKLADEYLGIPGDVETAIRVSATGSWDYSMGGKWHGGGAMSGHGSGGLATGGHVRGPGTETSDDIPVMLSDNEFVQRAAAVKKYGVGFMSALNEGRIDKRDLPGFAKGGWVSKGKGSKPWDQVSSHRSNVVTDYNRLVRSLVGSMGNSMAAEFKKMAKGPQGVLRLAESSVGRHPEVPNGSNKNAITSWFGMNGAPWCAMFISWLFNRTNSSAALGGASRTAWTGDYYGAGMRRVSDPMPGDVAVYGTRHVNLIASPGGRVRIGGNESNNVRKSTGYSGGAIFRPNWERLGFASGGLVSMRDLLAQNTEEDRQAGQTSMVRSLREAVGLDERPTRRARGGPVSSGQWSWVGEEGPELVKFSSPGQVYSAEQSRAIAADASQLSAGEGGGSAPLVGEYHQHLHNGEATFRQGMAELTHTLRVQRKGGRYADV